MKKIYVIFNTEINGKYHATAETIKAGENLLPFIERYKANCVHVCESRTTAETIAAAWNETYKNNNTALY